MTVSFLKRAVVVAIPLSVAVGICLHRGCGATGPRVPPADANVTVGPRNSTRNYDLAHDFIRWFESSYVDNMLEVNGRSTDVAESVERIGRDKTIDRYVAIRRMELDYAVNHPGDKPVPETHLDEITERKYRHVVSNTGSSKKWINYNDEKLRQGVMAAYRQEVLAWIPFYRRLLSGPTPSDETDFRGLIKRRFTREEYEKTVEQSLRGTVTFYASLKKGVAWYAPWSPWVKSSLDSACKKDVAIWRATVDEIYGRKR